MHDPKGRGLEESGNKPKRTSWIDVRSEPQRGEHQCGKFRKTLINVEMSPTIAYYPTHRRLSHSCIHWLPAHPSKRHPHAALHQSCEKGRGLVFLFQWKVNSRDKLFPWRQKIVEIENLIPAGAHTSIPLGPNRKRDLNWGSNVQWKSESPGKTQ